MWLLQKHPGGFIRIFIPVPIHPIAHPAWSNCTHHITIHSILCTTIIHNITNVEYYSRHIPDIRNRCHQIPDMFQWRNQHQVKSKEMDISIPPSITQPQRPGALMEWSPMCMIHRGGKLVLPLNMMVHICVYLLLLSPGYFQIVPITSFP